jgi:carbamoyltransferase
MQFDNQVRSELPGRIPVVLHLDGSAWLQTVDAATNPLLDALLREYEQLNGISVLCNTSANVSGGGIFPEVASALRWGKVRYVWNEGRLFERAAEPASLAVAEETFV